MRKLRNLFLLGTLALFCGCAALFGWKIHGLGILSNDFSYQVPKQAGRVALFIPEDLKQHVSTDKGNWHSDPQIYYIGESYAPMLVESFQRGFEEFILFETTPDLDTMKQYAIDHLAVVRIKDFKNRKNIKGQGLDLITETLVFKQDLNLLARFETRGSSDALAVFAKKGGLEVNLNAAIESNLISVIQFVQEQRAVAGGQA